MASVLLAERSPHPAPSRLAREPSTDYSITEVSLVLRDLSWDSTDGQPADFDEKLENEVMVDPWSSMDSTNSPLTDSGPSANDDCTPSTSSEPPRASGSATTPLSPLTRRLHDPIDTQPKIAPITDKVRSRDLTLDLETDLRQRKPHFLDEDYQPPSNSNIECRIPKPHFLDHSPSPDEFDERSDITNPNFLDDDVDDVQRKSGALPKKAQKPQVTSQDDKNSRANYRSALQYGLENAARSSERDKRASQLYRGTWPGEREWTGQDATSVKSFSSNGSADAPRHSANLDNKMECVCSLISLLSLSPENNADLSGPLLDISRSVESCIAMRQAGCIPLLVQLIHSKVARETRDRAAKALRNIIHTQTDDKAGRREARVWRLLEQVREYCYILEDIVESRKEGNVAVEDDASKHPSQSVAALMKLSFDEEHRHVVCQLGGLQALAALVSGDQAAHGSRTDDNTCLTMRKYAGMTLTNLTFGDGNNKSLLCSFKDFMLALVEQLESPNDDMRQVTAAVLRNLSWRADSSSKQILREVGAVNGLTKAAMTCQKEATLKSVLSALWNLTAHCSMNKVALCSVEGALGFLVDMLSYNSPTKTLAIVENAGGIMRNVSSHIAIREDYRQILRERNCLSVLLQHLKSPSLTVVSNSCGTLWNLSARCPLDQQFLWDHGAVPMLRSLIHSKHKMIAMGSSAALKNLLNSKPGKAHILTLDTTARNMNLPALPTLGVRKQKALEQELDQNLSETCDNIEPATSPTTTNRDEKNLFTATERHIAMNLERHRMTSSSPLMGALTSQMSLSHSAHLASYLSCSNTLLKGAVGARSTPGGSTNNVNRSDSKDSVTSTHSDTVFEKVMRTGKVPVPTPRNKDLVKAEASGEALKANSKTLPKDGAFLRYPTQAPVPPPRSTTEMRTNYTESGYDVDQDSCDQPIDFSRKYSETKTVEAETEEKPKEETTKKENSETFGDYQETDLDQPTDYSLRYAEHQSENSSDISEPAAPSIHEDTIKHFATEGTPYETPIIFSTATSMSDLRVIGKDKSKSTTTNVKLNPEVMTHSDEKDTCSIEDPPRHDNDIAITIPKNPVELEVAPEKTSLFDTKFSSGMISPEKPTNYCEEGTPGYFSRVSSLSSLGEPTEEDYLAKKNAMASINIDPNLQDDNTSTKDKEGSKAVTFATDTAPPSEPETPAIPSSLIPSSPGQFVEDTPLMFSRCSSLGSLPECSQQDDQGSVISEVSRLTSGCISPSEIPDSPTQTVPVSPRIPSNKDTQVEPSNENVAEHCVSVFEDRSSQFLVEDTPAQFSCATSLSSLTILDEPRTILLSQNRTINGEEAATSREHDNMETIREKSRITFMKNDMQDSNKGTHTPSDSFKVYLTEDTPAILSKAGSNSDLSVLSIDSKAPAYAADRAVNSDVQHDTTGSTSDSSNLSDSGDLLQECIYKGIAQVVKNKAPSSEVVSGMPFSSRDEIYRSLPPYLRSSTETVRMSQELPKNLSNSHSDGSPPPPLPPKSQSVEAPPRPPRELTITQGRKPESRLPVKAHNSREKPKLPATSNIARNDSLSSLSLDSFGSTDREIFEETVKAGLSSVNPKAKFSLDNSRGKAHSVERPSEFTRQGRHHKSLDRSDKISISKPKHKDVEFERNLASGAYNVNAHRIKREHDIVGSMSRSPFSFHGETSGHSLAHQSRYRGHNSRFYNDGPPSLPSRVDEHRRQLERSSSLSSLSNDSFGSTDKEVFERCVRMGMSKAQVKKRDEAKLRVRSDDRLEARDTHRSRRRRPNQGALDKMVGDDAKDRAILEEVIARGAGELKGSSGNQSKNVTTPPTENADVGGHGHTASNNGFDNDSAFDTSTEIDNENNITQEPTIFDISNELPTIDSGNTTFESVENEMEHSNECLAPKSANTTLESDIKDELNRSNESYADVLDGSWSEVGSPPKKYETATLTRKTKSGWTEINVAETNLLLDEHEHSRRSTDTWNDNTCLDDVTFPTISGSVHMISSIRSEVIDSAMALPDLLEQSSGNVLSFSRPDVTNRLDDENIDFLQNLHIDESSILDNIPEPSLVSLIDDGENKYDSIIRLAIEKEAARLAEQLKNSQYIMENSVTSVTSVDLDNVRPPSNLGSLLSLSASGQWDEPTAHTSKKSQKSIKKSLPVSIMVKRALSNSYNQGSCEHLDSTPQSISLLDNVKPPSEMENIDMENSMISVSSIVSEIVDTREKTPIVFDFKQPIQEFPHCNAFNAVYHDLDKINPPSLFDEMFESTLEIEQTTAHQLFDECTSTLNVVTDIPSGSENCSPLPSDISSVESTPKKHRDPKYLTPKEKRYVSKDRYQTYTITDNFSENDAILEAVSTSEQFMTWTKSDNERSEEYVTAASELKSKKKITAKQRRLEDRARYQTQTVDINSIFSSDATQSKVVESSIESLKQRLGVKKSMKQKRIEDAERFRTRTLSEDIPPSPTFVTKDANFENLETTTGYDSLSSNEPCHQQILDDRQRDDDVFSRDSGHNEDDFELNSTQMQTYTKSFRNYLPVVESPTAVDLCVINNLKNMEMTESYKRALQSDKLQNPSSSDFASYEGDSQSDGKAHSDSECEINYTRPKPKIVKPESVRDASLDSNDSNDNDRGSPKAIRGRKKASYVSPYRRDVPAPIKPSMPLTKPSPKMTMFANKTAAIYKTPKPKTPNKTPIASKSSSANTSPKKIPLFKSPAKLLQQNAFSVPLATGKSLPLERQGTFTKEESSVPPKDLPVPDKKTSNTRIGKTVTPIKAPVNTSPSRLPQLGRYSRPPLRKVNSNDSKTTPKVTKSTMKSSASNHSLQSNDSSKTVTVASKGSRQGSTSSVNSGSSKTHTKDVESRIASLWKRVEQSKNHPTKPDRRVWIESEKPEPPKLIRSSTFEGQPKQSQVPAASKQKTTIGIRVSQIPSLRNKTAASSKTQTVQSSTSKKPANGRTFTRKSLPEQMS